MKKGLSEIGRFINTDGTLGQVGSLGTNNVYSYCANNLVISRYAQSIRCLKLDWYDFRNWIFDIIIIEDKIDNNTRKHTRKHTR